MKNTLQLEMIPIKNFVLDKYEIKPHNYTLSMKNQKVSHHRNFMVLRSTNKNKKQIELLDLQKQISSQIKINRVPSRPRTSLSRSYTKKKKDHHQNTPTILKQPQDQQLKINVEINSARSTTKIDFINIIDTSNLKNCFPQRKAKKNTNQRWYQYCVSPNVEKKFRNMYIANNQTVSTIKTTSNNSNKVIKRPSFFRNKSEKKPKINIEKQNTVDISPWNTNFSQFYQK